ncbi:MAG: DUF423 domain-containing protein [Planctomycetota bacterium]
MSARVIVVLAGVVGFTGVLAGAFGAHGLEGRGVSEEALGWWETGARYHLIHGVALLGVGLLALHRPGGLATAAAVAFVFGVVVFAGTLYAMTLGGPRWLGAVTPIGGLGLMAGWVLTAAAALGGTRGVGSGG